VWITEYRHNILIDKKEALKAEDLIRQTDEAWRSIILSAHMSKDHGACLAKIGPIKIA
jgi:REP element-mobilizing transposase RayT